MSSKAPTIGAEATLRSGLCLGVGYHDAHPTLVLTRVVSVLVTCLEAAKHTVGLQAPWNSSPPFSMQRLGAGLQTAMDKINSEPVDLGNLSWEFTYTNSACSARESLAIFTDQVQREQVSALFGPACPEAAEWNIPVFDFVGQTAKLENDFLYDTYVKLVPPMHEIGDVLQKCLWYLGWKHVGMFGGHSGISSWHRVDELWRVVENELKSHFTITARAMIWPFCKRILGPCQQLPGVCALCASNTLSVKGRQSSYRLHRTMSPYSAYLHDAVQLYAQTVKDMIKAGRDFRDGRQLVSTLKGSHQTALQGMTAVILAITLLIIVLGAVLIGLILRMQRGKWLRPNKDIWWQIDYDDITILPQSKPPQRGTPVSRRDSGNSSSVMISGDFSSFIKGQWGKELLCAPVGLYQVYELRHENIVPFYDICTEPPNVCIVTQYCKKESLKDVLRNSGNEMDWIFKLSFAYDIVNGMLFLHRSPPGSHGNLKPSNCLVDGWMQVKLSVFGQWELKNGRTYKTYNEKKMDQAELYWTAPELLGLSEVPRSGTPKGDVYSFAVLMRELIHHQDHGPFAT
ncbi:hypothetical protein mRhiFer1_008523 [Rhinolophus ferrumequinum]|uniref:guanylate cyclase n=1 Tax=Rhinolophus ferrumequinum TaxID=59479 RepID=A0A7J7UX20_RHIFE|nr:hypothetical protein mRhiFer1_008523 [Rhinolophus ferrumequinum]